MYCVQDLKKVEAHRVAREAWASKARKKAGEESSRVAKAKKAEKAASASKPLEVYLLGFS